MEQWNGLITQIHSTEIEGERQGEERRVNETKREREEEKER